jgi:hypothetical protein
MLGEAMVPIGCQARLASGSGVGVGASEGDVVACDEAGEAEAPVGGLPAGDGAVLPQPVMRTRLRRDAPRSRDIVEALHSGTCR